MAESIDNRKEAKESLNKAQKEPKSTDYFRLAKSSYLCAKGEVYYRAGIMVKSLRILHKALKIMENVRSAFQMGEICRSLEDFDEAEEFYEQAWEIEKSLGQGNHSEVMVRIIESYEAMLLKGKRKDEFRQEAFDFYLRYWNEERAFEGFEFSPANKRVIDSINERLDEFGDLQTKKRYQKEALWFYEGAWNSPDTRKLPDTAREEILQTLCGLCKQLREKNMAEKYNNEAFRFYEKKWKRDKEGMSERDRIDILTTLVDMATSQMKEKKKQKYESLLKV